MKIRDIQASVHHVDVSIPLFDKPVVTRRIVHCEVTTDDGLTGYGLTGGQFLPFSVVTALHNEILDTVVGMDPRNTEAIHEKIWWDLNQRSMTGVISQALSALDIACWDIRGKKESRTVAELLGGCRDWAAVYVTFGFPKYDYDQLLDAAKIQLGEGVKRLKMVVGDDAQGGWEEDARRIKGVRGVIGDDVELMMDANYKLSPLDAKLLSRAVEECNLTWFEEPLHTNDPRALRELRETTRIPLAAGQMEGNRWRYRAFIDHQALDILQPNVCYNGGYTETLKVAGMAQAYNMPIANGGGWPLHNLHTMAGLMNGWRVEFHLGMQATGELLFKNPPKPEDNVVRVSNAPGLGLEPDLDTLKDTLVKPK